MKLIVSTITLFLFMLSSAFADLEKGYAAAQAGDFETAFNEYKQDAEAGNPEAQFLLSNMYFDGLGTKFNGALGMRWLRAAANQDHHDAQFSLGMLYANGRYVEKNDVEAFNWCLKAAENGNLLGYFSVATFYMQGKGTEVNQALGLEWHMKAAEQGLSESQNALSIMYKNGIGVEKDLNKSLEYLKAAAAGGHPAAVEKLNLLGLSINLDTSIPSNAIIERAEFARYSDDIDGAYQAYQEAAGMNNPIAQYQVGYYHLNGLGSLDTNYIEAHKWFTIAAENGDRLAIHNLGVMEMFGYGRKVDLIKAVSWFLIADTLQKDSEAEILQTLVPNLTPEQIEAVEEEANKWFNTHLR